MYGQGGGLGAAAWSGVFCQRLERWIYQVAELKGAMREADLENARAEVAERA